MKHKSHAHKPMTLLDHLIELRKRLIISLLGFIAASGACYLFAPEIFGFLTAPLVETLGQKAERHMIYTGLTEAFTTYLKLSMFGGLFLSFPIIANQIWMFIAPGLFKREKQVFLPFLIATPLLFLLGAALAYFVVIPMAWSFFLSFETSGSLNAMPIRFEAKIDEYLGTVMKIIFAFGFCFQLPVLLALLTRVGVISEETLKKNRKYAFLGIVIVAAILTPPDFLSPFLLIVPLTILYEFSILLAKWLSKRMHNSKTS
ncbi:MAG: twin-arginine translocase subunit TatC [Alphaproteobacteria bacterium]|nr:twin-arginine translocase subunit TatC [Alphaproteobacteria bacterium]OJV45639.1 MAG: twin arginine-targeting protein translocase TatC [Alphaproteobacteria bacterium 43-37]